MGSKVDFGALAVAVLVAVVAGLGVGLGIGLAARHFGLPTGWVGPLTGAIVGGLTPFIYQARAKAGPGGDH